VHSITGAHDQWRTSNHPVGPVFTPEDLTSMPIATPASQTRQPPKPTSCQLPTLCSAIPAELSLFLHPSFTHRLECGLHEHVHLPSCAVGPNRFGRMRVRGESAPCMIRDPNRAARKPERPLRESLRPRPQAGQAPSRPQNPPASTAVALPDSRSTPVARADLRRGLERTIAGTFTGQRRTRFGCLRKELANALIEANG